MTVDYREVGLKVGIEIHRQLDTEHKLFCNCPTGLTKQTPEISFLRKLRPTQSELGKIDPAALFEFQKQMSILYETDSQSTCLVEMDEEPPHNLNPEAIHAALQVSCVLGSKPVDEIHVMRKTVIDGSNTCGFQRTCIIALGGSVKVEGKEIPIQTICLEEDAARKMSEAEQETVYKLDRLGIPLIEVATAPTIASPEEAENAASFIGRILKGTGKVKRGIGTIRQDLNISVRGGALVEVKGVQELSLLSKVVEYEAQRQIGLLQIKAELGKRGLIPRSFTEDFVDVTDIFSESKSTVVGKAVSRGGVVLAVKVPMMAGVLKVELEPKLRFGTELAGRAKFYGDVGGIFHTDELPGYGITQDEVERLKARLGLQEGDATVLVADHPEKATRALEAVVERLREAVERVPEETRAAMPDGTTRYMRPRPGAARLYPETDVPPIPLPASLLEKVKETLPPPPEHLTAQLMENFNLNRKLAEQLADSEYMALFKRIAKETKVPPTFIATALTETLKSLGRRGLPVENISDEQFFEVFELIDDGKSTKEAFIDIVESMARDGSSASDALQKLGIRALTYEEVEATVRRLVEKNLDFVRQAPEKAFGRLMNIVMAEVRGRADAKTVAQILKERLGALA